MRRRRDISSVCLGNTTAGEMLLLLTRSLLRSNLQHRVEVLLILQQLAGNWLETG